MGALLLYAKVDRAGFRGLIARDLVAYCSSLDTFAGPVSHLASQYPSPISRASTKS